MRLVTILHEERRQCCRIEVEQQCRRRLAPVRVHPHVERARRLEGEAAAWRVELHRRHAEVRQQAVRAGQALRGERRRQAREVRSPRDEDVRAEAQAPHPGLCLRELQRIHVETQQLPARLDPLENGTRMASVAERAIDGCVSRSRIERFQDLGGQDWDVRAGGCLARVEYLANRIGVLLRLVLLVLLVELARVLAGVACAATVRRGGLAGHSSLYFAFEARALSTG